MAIDTVYTLTICCADGVCDLLGVFASPDAARLRAAEYCYDSSSSDEGIVLGGWGKYDVPEGCDMADVNCYPDDYAPEMWFNIYRVEVGKNYEYQVGISI
jgi:hypothetical protein